MGRLQDQVHSDVDPATAWTDPLQVTESLLDVDVGLVPLNPPDTSSQLPPAKVGPVRSGRLVYADIAAFFPQSCLIYAFASAEVLVELPQCAFVFHEIQGGGYMLDIDDMVAYTKDNQKPDQAFDYTSNIFGETPPAGGADAARLLSRLADRRALPPGTRLDREAAALLHRWYRAGYIALGDE